MLCEGGGGNVGVHADHHVLNLSSPHQPTTPSHNLCHRNTMAALPAHQSITTTHRPDHPTQPPLYQFIHVCIVLRSPCRLQNHSTQFLDSTFSTPLFIKSLSLGRLVESNASAMEVSMKRKIYIIFFSSVSSCSLQRFDQRENCEKMEMCLVNVQESDVMTDLYLS